MKNKNSFMLVLCALGAFGVLASDLYVPSLPHIAKSLATTGYMAKLTVTFYLLGLAISPLFFGPLADRYGRRPVILAGALIGVLGSFMSTVAPGIVTLMLARFIQSIGLGGVLALTRVVASDIFEGASLARVAAVISLCVSAGLAIAPVLGGYL